MSEIIKPLILDETGKAIVEALTQREMTKMRIAEINAAADAAKSGIETKTDEQVERIAEVTALAEDVNQLKDDLDKLNEGGLVLKDKVIEEDINKWLNEHPEATTTVQDNSLNESKFTLAARRRIAREYRTLADALSDNIWDINTIIRTHGFDTFDDGGGGIYIISDYSPNDGNPCYIQYRDGYYLNYIPENGRVNVLALGAKNDGSEDCSEIIQNFVQRRTVLTKQYYTLFFPTGIYRCDNPLEFTKDVSFEGVCSANAYNGFFYKDELYPKKFGSIIYYTGADDTTLMTVNISQNGCCSLKNLLFISGSAEFSNAGFATRPSIPYNPFTLTKNANNCNGVNIVKSKVSVDNCGFVGFSGFGLKTSSRNVSDCYFAKCGDGIELSASDLMLNNCYITQCINGIKCGSDGVLFVKNTFIDQCVEHGIYSDVAQTTLVVNGCIIDHIGYAGVYVRNSLDCNIDLRMGRCGMYYAGKTDFSDLSEDEKRKAVTIYFTNLHTGNMRLNIYKRNISDDSSEDTYKLPYVVFGGNYKNLVVTGLHGNDYKFFDDASVISNTTVYADDGIHTYS